MSTRSNVSLFCIAKAQASEHREGATKGEAKEFESRDLQVLEASTMIEVNKMQL